MQLFKRDFQLPSSWAALVFLTAVNYLLLWYVLFATPYSLFIFTIPILLAVYFGLKGLAYVILRLISSGPLPSSWAVILLVLLMQFTFLWFDYTVLARYDPNRGNIVQAIRDKNDGRLDYLLRISVKNDPDMQYLFNEAIASDNAHAIDRLIRKGADPKKRYNLDASESSAMYWRIVKWKLDSGVAPEELEIGNKISQVAAGHGVAEMEYFLQKGYDPKKYPMAIHDAISYHGLRKAGVMEPDEILAVRDEIILLLNHGADINGKDAVECTPLFTLIGKSVDYSPVLTLLIERGADINAGSGDEFMLEGSPDSKFPPGLTPLMFAVVMNRPDYAAILVKSGANKTLRDSKGFSALDYARIQESGATFVKLLEDPEIDTYYNWKFRFLVDFPKRLLVGQGESESRDGQSFESKDKTLKMTVSGMFNVRKQTISDRCKEDLALVSEERPSVITYRFLKGFVCAFSAVREGSTIIYQKTVLVDDKFNTLRLEYPLQQKQLLDPVVNGIIASFRSMPDH